ncbi:Molybdopterin synthase catalytic subunit [Nymphaea thermarum]|nr:Molybdopterin synthase catalytic subunit [Nymphaea thermarum]
MAAALPPSAQNPSAEPEESGGEGGGEEDLTLIEILEDSVPIDITKHMRFVRHESCGAIATFAGTTRSTFAGKAVLRLIYEAYAPMAVKRLLSIASTSRSRWPVRSVSIAHRLGTVAVGEESVFIAVSSVHRDASLAAVRFIIDEIKASVPIWKKEVFLDGEVWKENSEFFRFRETAGEGQVGSDDGKDTSVNIDKSRGCSCHTKVKVTDCS